MVAGILTVSQLASSALEDENTAGLGAGDCVETIADNPDMELHVEVDPDGFEHKHWRKKKHKKPGWGQEPPAEEEPGDEDPVDEEPGDEEPGDEEPGGCDGDGSDGDGSDGDGSDGDGSDGDGSDGDGSDGDGSDGDGSDGDGSDGDGSDGDGSDGDGSDGDGSDGDGSDPDENQFDQFGRTCAEVGNGLGIHTGFQQDAAVCVETQMGAIPAVEDSPSLIITDAPVTVGVNEPFAITVNTRNLVRDFFPPAGDGGYYRVANFLNEDGLIRGHFHTACIRLVDPTVAPDPETLLNPQFFVAVEDGGGGREPNDTVVPLDEGLPEAGQYRCMAWAGAASHAVPMLQFARMEIAADTIRIEVTD